VFREGEPAVAGEGAVYLVLDGILDAEIGGELVGEVGPGAIVGERGVLEGKRTATLTARTRAKLVSFDADAVDAGALASIGVERRREGTDSAAT
jgi:CRP-like cAMP-binding protein